MAPKFMKRSNDGGKGPGLGGRGRPVKVKPGEVAMRVTRSTSRADMKGDSSLSTSRSVPKPDLVKKGDKCMDKKQVKTDGAGVMKAKLKTRKNESFKLKSDTVKKDANHNIAPKNINQKNEVDSSLKTNASKSIQKPEIKPLMDLNPEELKNSFQSQAPGEDFDKYVSAATGLTILTATSVSGSQIKSSDRESLAKNLPDIVLINNYGKGESLHLGLAATPQKVINDINNLHLDFTFNLEDVSCNDPFSFLSGWEVVPRADKLGMYSLIINLQLRNNSKNTEMIETKRKLVKLLNDFNISKTMHGDNEVMIQVGHILEFIAYSDFIRKEFAIERRHTWQLQPTGKKVKSPDGANRYFMVSVDCPEMSQLSVAHKQFTVNYHLKNIGKVIQLEHNLFGVPDHYLAVFCGTEKLNVEEVQLKCTLVEVSPQTFPDAWLPTYGVDDFGFYTVSGTFPSKLSPQLREKFAADMKTAGAVGFRNNQSEEFTLHFVNSRCLEQIGKFSQYSSFNLKIHSSLVKKASLKNKIKKLVPAILKLKVVKGKVNGDVSVEAPTHANESNKVVKEAPKERVQSITDIKPNEDKKMESKSKPRKDQELPQTETAAGNNLEPRKGALNSEVDKKDSVIITENDLLKVNWNPGYSLAKSSQTFGKFLHSLGEYQVTNSKEGEITFRIKDRRHFIKELKFFSRNETNSLDKLSKAEDQRIMIKGSKKDNKMFGLAVPKKKHEMKSLETKLIKYGFHKIEDRAAVYIIWFQSKLDYYKAMGNPAINNGMTPCIVNFSEVEVQQLSNKSASSYVKANKTKNERIPGEELSAASSTGKASSSDGKLYQLTEKQVFGFIWKATSQEIRDDQIISRQLTEFIQNVVCETIENGDDGLVFNFANKADMDKVLAVYFEDGLKHSDALDDLSRKFTLIPFKGKFGIFCGKRIKPGEMKLFGKCKPFQSSIWYMDKMEVIRILRDPVIAKVNDALYFDCRNIYILKSIRTSPIDHPHPPRFNAPRFLTRPSFVGFTGPRMFRPRPISPPWIRPSMHQRFGSGSLVSKFFPRTFNGSIRRFNGNNILFGKFGVVPSQKLIRKGYKIFEMPVKDSKKDDAELFLEDKEQYRNKQVTAAANEVRSLLAGGSLGELSGSLKDMKMRRVELFLREKLGVEDLKLDDCNNVFLSYIECGENNSSRFEEVIDHKNDAKKSLTPDLLGLFTLSIPYTSENLESLTSMLMDDVSWFESPVSVLPATDPASGQSILEVKMKDEEVALAAFQGLNHKYPGLEVDSTGAHVDIIPDKDTGLYTLMFKDKLGKKYVGTLAVFKNYCSGQGPAIKKGDGAQEVLVAYKVKEDAVKALKENLDNPEFPDLHVAPSSRS